MYEIHHHFEFDNDTSYSTYTLDTNRHEALERALDVAGDTKITYYDCTPV